MGRRKGYRATLCIQGLRASGRGARTTQALGLCNQGPLRGTALRWREQRGEGPVALGAAEQVQGRSQGWWCHSGVYFVLKVKGSHRGDLGAILFPHPTHRYMKYLYPYECEKRGLSNPNELQAAIDSNRREGRRQSFGGSLFAYSPGGAHGMLSSPKLPVSSLGLAASTNGSSITPAPKIKKGKGLHGAWGVFPTELQPGWLTLGDTSSPLWVTRMKNPIVGMEKGFQSTVFCPWQTLPIHHRFSNPTQMAGRHC